MVTPRLESASVLDEGLDRTQAQVGGLIQRARLVEFDELEGTGTCTLYLRAGQTATVTGVLPIGDPDVVADAVGFDIVLLAPTGRPSDSAYVLGAAYGPGLLFDGLRMLPTLAIAAADSFGGNTPGWSATWRPREPGGAIRITRIEVGVDTISGAVPRIEITGGGVTAFYTADESSIPADALIDRADWQERIPPVMTCRPESEPFVLDEVQAFTVTARAHRFAGTVASWRGFTSSRPVPATRVEPLLEVASPRPSIRLYGRVARRLD